MGLVFLRIETLLNHKLIAFHLSDCYLDAEKIKAKLWVRVWVCVPGLVWLWCVVGVCMGKKSPPLVKGCHGVGAWRVW